LLKGEGINKIVISLDIKQEIQCNPISWAIATYKRCLILGYVSSEYNFDSKAKQQCEIYKHICLKPVPGNQIVASED